MANQNKQLAVVPQESGIIPHETGRLVKRTFLDLQSNEFERIENIAKVLAKSTFNPKLDGKPQRSVEDFMMIMFKGMELGFPPLASLDMISVIKGKPTIDGKGMLALAFASGVLEDISIATDEKSCTVTIKRKGVSSPFVFTFTIADAQAMGLTKNKEGKEHGTQYQKQPKIMLKWRAVANCLREAMPDYLGGLYTHEELAPHNVTVFEDGSMEVSQLPLNHAPQLPAQSRDINNVDEMIFGNEETQEQEAERIVRHVSDGQWEEDLKDIIAPMYSNEFHLNNGVKAALERGANGDEDGITIAMSLDKAAFKMFQHRCIKEWGYTPEELPMAVDKALGVGLRQYLADNPRDYKGVWQAMMAMGEMPL